MLSTRIIKLLTVLLILTMAGCGYSGSIRTEGGELEKVAGQFQPLLQALEAYKNDFGEYPDDIISLNPKYTKGLLMHGGWKQYDGVRFGYANSLKTGHSAEEAESWGGYEISLYDIRQFTVLMPKAIRIFVYRPSQFYPDRKYETPIKKVEGWALITRRRPLHGESPDINPIEGPGV